MRTAAESRSSSARVVARIFAFGCHCARRKVPSRFGPMLPLDVRILGACALAAALLCGCETTGFGHRSSAAPVFAELPADVNPVVAALQLMSELPQKDPAGQAELFQAAKEAAEFTPTTSNKLKFALALATPGHSGSDPVAAQRHLAELLATPENLLPIEHYL